MKLILSALLLLSPMVSADVLFRSGCGGEPHSHIKWSIYVPEGYRDAEVWRLRDQIWTVEKDRGQDQEDGSDPKEGGGALHKGGQQWVRPQQWAGPNG